MCVCHKVGCIPWAVLPQFQPDKQGVHSIGVSWTDEPLRGQGQHVLHPRRKVEMNFFDHFQNFILMINVISALCAVLDLEIYLTFGFEILMMDEVGGVQEM